jgi:glycogen debranching enzyme
MSYHNGSIPHDNAVIASGLAQYGLKDMAIRILTGLFDASLFMHLHRLPELFAASSAPGREPHPVPGGLRAAGRPRPAASCC